MLQPGDVIVAVDGNPVTTGAGAATAVAAHHPWDPVRLGVGRRPGPPGDADVVLATNVAVTGQLEADGTVSAIGGIAQKVAAVRAAGATAFIVPIGNETEARAHAGPTRGSSGRPHSTAARRARSATLC